MMNLEELVVNDLTELEYTIAFAESCTGGMAAARLINVPSASKVINFSLVTYSNEMKESLLGVEKATLDNFGAVSPQTVSEMAGGLISKYGADVGVSISGIAGPSGGTPEKPVGTVCFGINVRGKEALFTEHFENLSRNEVRGQSVEFVFGKLHDILTEERKI